MESASLGFQTRTGPAQPFVEIGQGGLLNLCFEPFFRQKAQVPSTMRDLGSFFTAWAELPQRLLLLQLVGATTVSAILVPLKTGAAKQPRIKP